MRIVFLSFFVCCLSAGSNQLKIFKNKNDFYCFSKVSPQEICTLSQQEAGCLATLTPPGKYSLQFFQKKKFNNQIALLRYYDSFKDYKGDIKVCPQTNNDNSFKSYYKNLELLLKRENFSSPDNTIMELSEDFLAAIVLKK